jgi:glucose dehydrogenase
MVRSMLRVGYLAITAVVGLVDLAASEASTKKIDPCPEPSPIAECPHPSGMYQRFSKLKQIDAGNVGRLQIAWTFWTGPLRGRGGAPLVVGHVLYLQASEALYALNLYDDNRVVWKYEPKQDPNFNPVMCCDTVKRGVAYADGKIFVHRADTTLVALDAKTGNVVWSVKNGDPSKGETGASAPHVFNDKVIISISGGEFGVRGSVTAYNIKDGKQVWRGYSMGPDSDTLIDPAKTTNLRKPVGPSSGTNTWQGEQWKIGGGTAWGWYSFDPETNLMYYGTGNPSTWNPRQRPGDNQWSMTIFARDVDTGMARWVYQMTPHDDYDGVNDVLLTDERIGGAKRKAVVHFDRNGLAHTLDRVTGELLIVEQYDSKVNAMVGVHTNCPAALSTIDQQPAAFSPETGLFYVPSNRVCVQYPSRVTLPTGGPLGSAKASVHAPPGEGNIGRLVAWDAHAGKIVWSNQEQFLAPSGALTTAGGLVFYGAAGYLKAVDAKTGKELYNFPTPTAFIDEVTTYEHGGKQYVAIMSGVGGTADRGVAAGSNDPTADLGAVGGYAGLRNYATVGGTLTVLALPND